MIQELLYPLPRIHPKQRKLSFTLYIFAYGFVILALYAVVLALLGQASGSVVEPLLIIGTGALFFALAGEVANGVRGHQAGHNFELFIFPELFILIILFAISIGLENRNTGLLGELISILVIGLSVLGIYQTVRGVREGPKYPSER